MDAHARLFVSRLEKRGRGNPVIFAEEVSEPTDDGRYVVIRVLRDGMTAATVVFTSEAFRAAFEKVAVALGEMEWVH